jgi:hypothetical protein
MTAASAKYEMAHNFGAGHPTLRLGCSMDRLSEADLPESELGAFRFAPLSINNRTTTTLIHHGKAQSASPVCCLGSREPIHRPKTDNVVGYGSGQ